MTHVQSHTYTVPLPQHATVPHWTISGKMEGCQHRHTDVTTPSESLSWLRVPRAARGGQQRVKGGRQRKAHSCGGPSWVMGCKGPTDPMIARGSQSVLGTNAVSALAASSMSAALS